MHCAYSLSQFMALFISDHLFVKSSPHHGQYRGIVSNSVQLVM